MESEFLPINDELVIPLAELQFRFSRSSGPGGQHVQKSSTRVELYFDVLGSPSLTEEQRSASYRGWQATSTPQACCTWSPSRSAASCATGRR